MLEIMRSHAQSWIAKLILGGVVLSFALWGVGDYFLGSRVKTVAKVDGDPVTDVEFRQAYTRQLNTFRLMLGKRFSKEELEKSGLKTEVLQTIINRRLVLSEAGRMGIVAPKAVLLKQVRANPAFQSAGSFDVTRYYALTQRMGFLSPTDYEDEQRLNMMVDALQKPILNSAIVSEREVRERFAIENERRILAALIVDPAKLESKAAITEQQARDYHDKHKEKYRSLLKLRLAVVEIRPDDLAKDIEIDNADIEAAYEERKDAYIEPEQRRARHLLVRVDENADEKTRVMARKKIEAALARIRAGEAFAKVAAAVSDDPGTASKGGDLGFFRQGVMAPAFDQVVFAMKPNEISDVVETRFGYHIIRLTDIRPARTKALKEVRDEIEAQLRHNKARDEAYNLSQDLDDALGREDTLAAAAKSLNLRVRELGPTSLNKALTNALFAANPDYLKQIFSMQAGDPVQVMELDDGRFVAIEVLERIPPQVLAYTQVAATVHADAKSEAAKKLAAAKAVKILKQAETVPLDTLAQQYGLPLYYSKPVRRNGSGGDAAWLTSDILELAFATPSGKIGKRVVETPQGMAIIDVRKIVAAPESEYAKQAEGIRRRLSKANGAVRFARWIRSVRDRHEILIDQAELERQ